MCSWQATTAPSLRTAKRVRARRTPSWDRDAAMARPTSEGCYLACFSTCSIPLMRKLEALLMALKSSIAATALAWVSVARVFVFLFVPLVFVSRSVTWLVRFVGTFGQAIIWAMHE